MLSQKLTLAAAGNAADPVYVDDVFSTFLYDGTSAAQTITNGVDLSGEGGLVWFKDRTSGWAHQHHLIDTERGATKVLYSDATVNEATDTNSLTAFNSDGFSIGSTGAINYSGNIFTSWTFRKCPGFFDVVTYTGDGNASKTISHSLGSTPGFLIVKRTDSGGYGWYCYHRGLSQATTQFVRLESTMAQYSFNNNNFWGVSSTDFTVYGATTDTNISGATYVAYLFAHDDQSFGDDGNEAIIKCGSYTGDGTTNGTNTVNLGFEPQWILTKRVDSTDNWHICDVMRGQTTDGSTQRLRANTNDAESGNFGAVPTSTGFKLYSDNTNGGTFIYMAIRRSHKPPSAGTDVLAIDPYSGSSTLPFEASFAPDLAFIKHLTSASSWFWSDRLRGDKAVNSNYANAEAQSSAYGVQFRGAFSQSWTGYIGYMLKRAAGFFDVVAYTGNGLLSSVDHNLGVVPEIIFVKRRSANDSWAVYHKALGSSNELWLDQNYASMSNALFGGIDPVATAFYAKADNQINGNGQTYVAYLFATMAGISKVGSYSGSGTTHNIDCGFTNGARFVLIKRTDSAADWYLFDTTQGINSGNEPFLRLNLTYAQTTGDNFVGPLSSGFQLVTGDHVVNGVGASYIFLAIA